MEWSTDLTFEFLNLYQNEPTLWNAKTSEHKNKNDSFDAWCRIKSQLKGGSMSMNDIKKKRDNLMSTYRRHRTKVKDSLRTGSGVTEIYKPEWQYYSQMAAFLDDVHKPNKTRSSEDSEDTINIEDNSLDELENLPSFKIPRTNLSRKTLKTSNEAEEARKRSEEAFTVLKEMSKKPDTCSLYCDLLCNKLRLLKENSRDVAMMEIDRLVYNLKQVENRATDLQFQQPYYCSTQSSHTQPPHYSSAFPFPRQSQHQQVSLPSTSYSHSSNSQSSRQHEDIFLPSSGFSQSSRQHKDITLASPGYSKSSRTHKDIPLASPGYSQSSRDYQKISPSPPGYIHTSISLSPPLSPCSQND